MKNRNKNELIKDTYNIYFILLLVITFALFIVKLIFEQSFIVVNHLTEFVVIVSVTSILLKAPKDADNEPLSDYYSKSIKRIFMIGVLSYTVQQVLAIKLNVYEAKRIQIYYVSAYLSAIVISLFILKGIKKVYLNYKIIEEKKEVYWSKVWN